MNAGASGLRDTGPFSGNRPWHDGGRDGRQELAMSVLATTLPLGSQPATNKDCKGDDRNDENGRCASGKLAHWKLTRENPPCVLADCVGLVLDLHLLGDLLPVEPVQSAVLPEFSGIIVGGTHNEDLEKETFSFNLSDLRGDSLSSELDLDSKIFPLP